MSARFVCSKSTMRSKNQRRESASCIHPIIPFPCISIHVKAARKKSVVIQILLPACLPRLVARCLGVLHCLVGRAHCVCCASWKTGIQHAPVQCSGSTPRMHRKYTCTSYILIGNIRYAQSNGTNVNCSLRDDGLCLAFQEIGPSC